MKNILILFGLSAFISTAACKDPGANGDDPTSPGTEIRPETEGKDPHGENAGNYMYDTRDKDSSVQSLPDPENKN